MGTWYVDTANGNNSNAGTSPGAGNAFATIQKGLDQLTANNGSLVYVKASGTYSISAGLTWPAGPSYTGVTRLIGYTTTPGDSGKVTVQASAGSIAMMTMSQDGISVENFDFDGNSHTGVTGVAVTGTFGLHLSNVKVRRCDTVGINASNLTEIRNCEVTACAGTAAVVLGSKCGLFNSWIHDNTTIGVYSGGDSFSIIDNVISKNTGGSSDGIQYGNYWGIIRGNTIHGNGRDGIQAGSSYIAIQSDITYNILTGNTRYGFNLPSAPASNIILAIDFNAYYNNTSGPINNVTAGANDVTLSGLPYTNTAGDDYSLNNTAGQGAACREIARTLSWGAITYRDIGALQHQDSAGGGSTVIVVEE